MDPQPVSSRNSTVSPALDATIARALAKDPDQRYATAAALANALAEALSPPSVAPHTPRDRIRTRWRLSSTRRAVALGSAGLLGMGVVGWAIGSRVALHERGEERSAPDRADLQAPSIERPAPPPGALGQTVTSAAPPREMVAEPATNSALLERGTLRIVTNPSVDVWLDGHYQGRTTAQPLVIADVNAGERRITLRHGSREHELRRTLRVGVPWALSHYFPETPATDSGEARSSGSATSAAPPGAASARVAAMCLSVNAMPFAQVFVDGHDAGETPKGCLRVSVGEHRVHFEARGERSPERVVQVTAAHTARDAVRVSYDFRTRRFVD